MYEPIHHARALPICSALHPPTLRCVVHQPNSLSHTHTRTRARTAWSLYSFLSPFSVYLPIKLNATLPNLGSFELCDGNSRTTATEGGLRDKWGTMIRAQSLYE